MNTLGWQELKVVALAVVTWQGGRFLSHEVGLEFVLAAMVTGFALGSLTILLKPVAECESVRKASFPRLTSLLRMRLSRAGPVGLGGVTIMTRSNFYEEGRFWVVCWTARQQAVVLFRSAQRRRSTGLTEVRAQTVRSGLGIHSSLRAKRNGRELQRHRC